ncbi:hypothetical protein ACVGVM_06475 [Pseudonocardia bannensis]|uniref:Uncharacterized protein n=1 Tax=Pseudonocardia bannensis TaxID=630973 RepID=A0A848DKE4_9PSEU|nr:hypothetical protein [Pseudonocardia bannensis]NMH93187.1 hypothetical protein [Pseudonocardia bannensis]
MLGVIGALVGALIGSAASFGGQIYVGHQQVAKEDRDKKAAVYFAYLDAANELANETRDLQRSYASLPPDAPPPAAAYGEWQTARFKYQGAINDLSVYGSDAAWDIHRRVAAALPRSLNPSRDPVRVEAVDDARLTSGTQDFLDLACQELPASPRAGCGD